MNFYQELQLNQAGSKSYIASFKNPKDKCKHIAVYSKLHWLLLFVFPLSHYFLYFLAMKTALPVWLYCFAC